MSVSRDTSLVLHEEDLENLLQPKNMQISALEITLDTTNVENTLVTIYITDIVTAQLNLNSSWE